MADFSPRSRERLGSCDERLQRLFRAVLKRADCTIICGHRTAIDQDEAVRTGKSKLAWPNSKHNSLPSRAVDVAPCWPAPTHIPWDNRRAFDLFAGIVLATAEELGIKVRWGGDWDANRIPGDESAFHDLPHWELAD